MQDTPTPSLLLDNPSQVPRIRAWWATIEEAIAAAGGFNEALKLVAPDSTVSTATNAVSRVEAGRSDVRARIQWGK
jgi:hypothetical protein